MTSSCPHDELSRRDGVTWCELCSRRVDDVELPSVVVDVVEQLDAPIAPVLPMPVRGWSREAVAPFLDKNGRPITAQRFEELRADPSYWRIGYDELPGDVVVSTVWLGVDYGLGQGIVQLFETAISHGVVIDVARRYSTEGEAVLGHHAIVRALGGGTQLVAVDDESDDE